MRPKQQCLQLTAAGTQIFFGRRVTAKRQSKQRTEGFFSIAKQQNNNASQQRLAEKSIFTAGSLPAQKRPFDKLGKMVTPETAEKMPDVSTRTGKEQKKYDIFELNHKIFTLN